MAAHEDPGSFLNKPPVPLDPTITVPGYTANIAEGPGTEIGRYKLLEQIGEGGMGVVYMAEQREPIQRRVALKIIKPGMDSQQVIARFEAERQALAMMEHQYIARVLDVGTTDTARPYFVMELVRGVPITNYCDKNNLSPRERLELFIPICQAIQHAHQKGIIHRDIKPTNVLVCLYDGKPVPKVIDFGIAKAVQQRLTEKTMFTQHGQIVGTLEYMSPEQAEMSQLDIDTRSDVYSLGVLLYELLTGTTPITKDQLREAGFMEMLRLIREEEPDKPSTRLSQSADALPAISAQRKTEPKKLSMILRGELDWIVMKALEKDRTRRYESSSALAADVERYLKDEPVQACPPSAAYRFRKFAHKHRVAITVVACFAALLLLGTVFSAWQAVRAMHAEAQASQALFFERIALEQASEARGQAESERDRALVAEETAKDTLARSLFEQARAVRLAAQSGHRWKSLDLLEQAETLRGRERRKARETLSAVALPTRAELRSEAVASLLERDARVERELGGLYQTVDPLGQFAGLMEFQTQADGLPKIGVRVVELASDKELAQLDLGTAADSLGTTSFAVGPRAKLIATSYPDVIRLIEVASGREVGSLAWPPAPAERGPRGRVMSSMTWVEFSPNGRYLSAFRVGASIGEIALWELPESFGDAATRPIEGRQLATTRELALVSPNFSADSKRLAYPSSEHGVAIWSLDRNEVELEFEITTPMRPFGPLGFAPDGRSLALVAVSDEPEESSIVVWDLEANKQSLVIATGRTAWIAPPRISPDNSRLLTGTMQGEGAVFRLDDQTEELRLDHGAAVRLVGWLDNDRLYSVGAMAMKEWKLATDRPVRDLQTESPGDFGTSKFSFNRDGRWIAVAARRDVRIYRWPAFTLHRQFEAPTAILRVHFDAGGKQSILSGWSATAAYDLETGEHLWSEDEQNCLAAAVTVDGHVLFLQMLGGQIVVTRTGGDQPVWQSTSEVAPGTQKGATLSPDGRRLATWLLSHRPSEKPSSLEIWNLNEDRKTLELLDVDNPMTAQFSANGESLVTIHMNNLLARFMAATSDVTATARVWDVESGAKKLEISGPQIMSYAISQDDRLLAVQFPGRRIELWNTDTREHLFTWTLPQHDPSLVRATEIGFTPDGIQLGAVVDSMGNIQFLNLASVRRDLEAIGLGW